MWGRMRGSGGHTGVNKMDVEEKKTRIFGKRWACGRLMGVEIIIVLVGG